MKTRSKLESLPANIKAELVERILKESDTYEELSKWLNQSHGYTHSKSAIGRFAQAVKLMRSGLVDLGMSPATLAAHADQLEKLGALLVQRAYLEHRINALQNAIFDDTSARNF